MLNTLSLLKAKEYSFEARMLRGTGDTTLEVFPNPSSTMLYIKSSSKDNRELYNSIGQLLFTTKENEINVSRYSTGVYYLKVANTFKKIIIE